VAQNLAPTSTVSEDTGLEELILIRAKSIDSILASHRLLVSLFTTYGINEDNSSSFDKLLSHLVKTETVKSLTWLVLILGWDKKIGGVEVLSDVDKVKKDEIDSWMLVRDEDGVIKGYKVSKKHSTKQALWKILQSTLELVFGEQVKKTFQRILKEGKEVLDEEKKDSDTMKKTKKKKVDSEPSQLDLLVAFGGKKVLSASNG
jgi:hypothetical protein